MFVTNSHLIPRHMKRDSSEDFDAGSMCPFTADSMTDVVVCCDS